MENVKPKPTMEDVNEAWKKWTAYTKTVEQHDFFNVFWKEIRFKAMYTSLQMDWNEDHAAIFLRCVELAIGKSEVKNG